MCHNQNFRHNLLLFCYAVCFSIFSLSLSHLCTRLHSFAHQKLIYAMNAKQFANTHSLQTDDESEAVFTLAKCTLNSLGSMHVCACPFSSVRCSCRTMNVCTFQCELEIMSLDVCKPNTLHAVLAMHSMQQVSNGVLRSIVAVSN